MATMPLKMWLSLVTILLLTVVGRATSLEFPFGGKNRAHERHLQECNVILANWTVDELSASLESAIDGALGAGSTEAALAQLTLLPKLAHGVSVRRVCASCSEFSVDSQPAAFAEFCTGYGSDTDFSGLLMIPLDEDESIVSGTHPGGIWCHGTTTQSVPSLEFRGDDSGIDLFVNAAIASAGSVTLMPDYMGYGVSSGEVFKAYLVKQQYHTSIIPLWLKAGKVVQEESDCAAALADSVAILGYSEGGYAAVALAEGLYNMDVDILKVEAGAGPYRMGSAALLEGQRLVDEGIYPLSVREYFALVGAAYSSTYPELANFEEGQDLLSSDVRDDIVSLVTASASKADIQALIPTDDPTSVFSPQLVAFTRMAILDGDTDPCRNPDRVIQGLNDLICEALQENDLTEILETTPYNVRLCHSPDDDVVSYANLPDFDGNVLLELLDSTGNHVEAATTCLLQSVLFMLSDDFLNAQVAEKSTDLGCAAIGVSGSETLEPSMAPDENTVVPTVTRSSVPTMTPIPTITPRPTNSPTKENQCGEILASWTADEARSLVTEMFSETFGANSQEFALFELFADESFMYGVEIRKVCATCDPMTDDPSSYCAPGVYGSDATQSGLLMIPLSSDGTAIAGGTFPGFIYNHDPTVDRAPSNEWSGDGHSMVTAIMFGILPAAAGSIAIMPDYLGYGESNAEVFKGFFVKESYKTSVLPLWKETATILETETNCTYLADAAMISGFCEGGYASIAVADALRDLGVDIIRVHAGAVPARLGSVFIPELVKSIDSNTTFPPSERFILALFGSAYSATYTGLSNFEEGPYLLNSTTRDDIVSLVSRAVSQSSVDDAIPRDNLLSIWNQDVVTWARRAYLRNDTDPCVAANFTTEGFQLFCDALAANDLTNILESATYPITICQGRDDGVVAVANIPNASSNTNLLISLVDGTHAESYVTCTSQIITFLSSPTYLNYPIVPKHDESVCAGAGSSASSPTPSPVFVPSIVAESSAQGKTTTATMLVSILCVALMTPFLL